MGTISGVSALSFSFFLRERFGEELCGDAALKELADSCGLSASELHAQGRDLGHVYSEAAYIKLVQGLLEKEGGFTLPQLMFEFGRYFMTWLSVRAGYAESMARIAGTLVDYVRALNRFLEQMYRSLGNPNSTLPHMHVINVEQHSFVVQILSTTVTRTMFLQGIIDNIATEVFNVQLQFEQLGCAADEQGYSLIRITSTSPVTDGVKVPEFGPQSGSPLAGLGPENFYRLFPFHLVLDSGLQVVQAGSLLQKIVPQLRAPGIRVNEVLTIQSPRTTWDMRALELLAQNEKQKLVLSGPDEVKLQGGIYKVPMIRRAPDGSLQEGEDVLVLLLSLHMTDLLDHTHGLFLADFPAHDITPDLILNETMIMLDLEEERQNNCALKETLAETLAAHAQGARAGATFNPDSAAHVTIKLLDSLIMGEDVAIQDVLQARDSLLRAGNNVWKPLDLDANAIDKDEEVSRSLGEMLGALSKKERDSSSARGAFEVSALTSRGSLRQRQPSRRPSLGQTLETQVSGRRQDRPSIERMVSILKRSSGGSAGSAAEAAASPTGSEAAARHVRLPEPEGGGQQDGGNWPSAVRKRSGRSITLHRNAGPEAEGLRSRRSSVTAYEPIMSGGPRLGEIPSIGSQHSLDTMQTSSHAASKSAQASPPSSQASTSTSPRTGKGPDAGDLQAQLLTSINGWHGRPPPPFTPPGASGQGQDHDTRSLLPGLELPSVLRHRDQDGHRGGSSRGIKTPLLESSSLPRQAPPKPTVNTLLMPSLLPKSRNGTPRSKPAGGQLAGCDSSCSNGSVSISSPTGQKPISASQLADLVLGTKPFPPSPAQYNFDIDAVMRLTAHPPEELAPVLTHVDDWQFDSFELHRVCNGRPLSCLGFYLMKRMGLTSSLNLDEQRLARFLMRIEEGYQDNPYHCRIHAADVLRTFHTVLTRGGVMETVNLAAQNAPPSNTASQLPSVLEGEDATAVRLFACYLAAITHDFEHRGVTNDFLIRCSDPLALIYNDISPLENHHVSASFLLMRDPQYAFFPPASKRMQDAVRKEVIDLVLATDMKQHFALLGVFNSKVVQSHDHASAQQKAHAVMQQISGPDTPPSVLTKAASIRVVHELTKLGSLRELTRSASSHSNQSGLHRRAAAEPAAPSLAWDHETQMLGLKVALKCADLGHLASSKDVHLHWVSRLEEELFRQGDQEKALGQPVSPLMDRGKAGVTKSQQGFFNVVALPLFKSMAKVFPGCDALHMNVTFNGLYWKEVEAKQPKP